MQIKFKSRTNLFFALLRLKFFLLLPMHLKNHKKYIWETLIAVESNNLVQQSFFWFFLVGAKNLHENVAEL